MEPSFRLGFVLSIASLCILSSFSSAVNISEESDSQSQSQYYHGNENVFVTGNRPYLTSQHFRSVNGKPIPERSKVSNPFLRRLAIPSYLKKITKWHSEDLQQLDLFEGVDSVSCRAHVTELFGRIRSPDTDWLAKENAWVIQLFDSWGKIPEGILTGHVNNFGDFDECINIDETDLELKYSQQFPGAETEFQGQYCMTYMADYTTAMKGADREVEETKNELGTRRRSGRAGAGIQDSETYPGFQDFLFKTVGILKPQPSIGTCMPNSCNQTEIQRIFVNGLTSYYLSKNESADLSKLLWPLAMLCRVKDTGGLDSSAIGVMAMLGFFAVLAVAMGVVDYFYSNHTKAKRRPNGTVFKYLMAFSLYTNTKKWLSTRKSPEDFGCLHGIRSLTTAWVVLCHTVAVNMFVPQWNHISAVRMADNHPAILAIINGFFCVDTFFLMSGLLVAYNIMKVLDKSKGKLNLPMFYLHRYLRLTPTYAVLVAMGATMLSLLGNGPYWGVMETQEKYCRDNWWTNLLYINNVVKVDEMCNGESWYLANDMQFYVLAPAIVYPIWRWELVGLALSFIYFVVSCFAIPLLANYHDTPPTTIVVRRMKNWQTMIYIRPYSRIGVFIIGIWLGWLLFKTRGKKLRIPKLVVLAGWLASAASALYVIYCILPWYDPDYEIPKAYGYFYAGLSRPIWGFAVGWVIFACVKGYGGFINDFLSWSVFMPLGRLTFCVYLTSYHLQQMFILRSRQPPQFEMYYLTNLFFAHFVFSCIVGYFCTLFYESPFMNLQKLIFEGGGTPKPKPQVEANGQKIDKIS